MLAASSSYRLRAGILRRCRDWHSAFTLQRRSAPRRRRFPWEAAEDLHKLLSPAGVMLGRARIADSGVSKSQYSSGARFL